MRHSMYRLLFIAMSLMACQSSTPTDASSDDDDDDDDSGSRSTSPLPATSTGRADDGREAPPVTTDNGGFDPRRPELAPEDLRFVDSKAGWGWSDRCWTNIGKNRLGYAKAECTEGLRVAPNPGEPKGARPSLLYNLGLIEERSGNTAGARDLFEQSLAIRPHAEVEAALRRVGGSPKTSKPNTNSGKEASCRRLCPGGEISHCYCVCMGQCTD